MQYEKKIRDAFNDEAEVSVGVSSADEYVLLAFPEDAGDEMVYTPSQARRLARALKRAANVAEGKPAKAPKPPRVLVDGEGDKWDRVGRGLYTCRGHEYDCTVPEHHVRQTPDAIRERFGIREEIA